MRTRPVQQGMSIIRRQLLRAGCADSGMDSHWQAGLLGKQMWHATPLRSALLSEVSHTVLEKTCRAQGWQGAHLESHAVCLPHV